MACTSHVTAYIAHNVTILVFALNTNMIATATAAIRTLNTEQSRWREKALYSRNSQTENRDNTQRSHRHKPQW